MVAKRKAKTVIGVGDLYRCGPLIAILLAEKVGKVREAGLGTGIPKFHKGGRYLLKSKPIIATASSRFMNAYK